MKRWNYRRLNEGTTCDEWQVYEVGTLCHVWSFPPSGEENAALLAHRLNSAEDERKRREESL